MGIYDRDYVRDRSPRRGPAMGMGSMRRVSVNKWLIIVNVAVFVLGGFMTRSIAFQGQMVDPLFYYGHFSTNELFHLKVWRLVTFQFLHANLTHIFFNMFGLWIFGSMVEETLGSKKYLAFYLVCGIFGGLMYLLLNLMGVWQIPLPGALAIRMDTPLIGASAGVFGVIVACAYIAPNSIVQLLFPPIPMRLKWMAYGYVGLALFNLLTNGSNAGGDAAHIGGAIAGYFFIRNHHLLTDFFDVTKDSRKTASTVRGGGPRFTSPSEAEIDRILAKVSSRGLASLSESEKRTLADDSARRRKRRA
jgi:rhomboid family protein